MINEEGRIEPQVCSRKPSEGFQKPLEGKKSLTIDH